MPKCKHTNEEIAETSLDIKRWAVTIGVDAMRICLGMKPTNHKTEDVVRWVKTMADEST